MIIRFLVWSRSERFAVRFWSTAVAVLVAFAALPASAATLLPLSSWSPDLDGWLAPGEGGYGFLGTGNNERGLAYGNGHVYLVSHGGGSFVRILDSLSGTDIGSLDTTSTNVGTFGVNNIAVGGDGTIYVANLTTQSTTTPYRVYSWATEASAPVVAYSGDGGLPGSRLGDDLAAIGSGSSTRLVAGYGNVPAVGGSNGYALIDPTAGTATAVAFAGTPPNAGDFRLGIIFTDASHVIGAQGGSLYRYSSFSGASGTLIASPAIPDPAGATADHLFAYTVVGGLPILAVQSNGDSHISVYSIADPSAPIYLASRNATTGTLSSNVNGTGELAWGATTVNGDGSISQILYAMSSNQGIQAFTFTLESPVVPGDYNGNHVVDAADYVIWRKTLDGTVFPNGSGADGSGNGTIGTEDYNFWRERFANGNGGPGSGAIQSGTIPEPRTFVLALLAVVGGIPRRGRHWTNSIDA